MKSGDRTSQRKNINPSEMNVKLFNELLAEYHYSNYLLYVPPQFHHCTLGNFDFSEQKPEMMQCLKNFIEQSEKEKGLYMYGSFGVGKTHLLVALYRVIVKLEEDPSESFAYYSSLENIMKELFKRLDKKDRELGTPTEYIEFLTETNWLFLDDITATPLKDYTLEVLRKIINARYEMQLPTCFAANSDLKELEVDGLHPHAISRILGMCKVIKIFGEDRRVSEDKRRL